MERAVRDGGGEHSAQRLGGGSVGLGAAVFDLDDIGGEHGFDRTRRSRVVLPSLCWRLTSMRNPGLGAIGGKRIAAVQQFLRLDACQPIRAQPVDGLKADDSLLRIRAERAVRPRRSGSPDR